jgi:hypothetical protein
MFPTITNVLNEAKDPLAAVTSVLQANNSSITVVPVPDEPKPVVCRNQYAPVAPQQFQGVFTPPKERPGVEVPVPAPVSQSVIYQPIFPRSTGDGTSRLPPPPFPEILPIVAPVPFQRVPPPPLPVIQGLPSCPPAAVVQVPKPVVVDPPPVQNGIVPNKPPVTPKFLTPEKPKTTMELKSPPKSGSTVDPFDELLKSTKSPKKKPRGVARKASPVVSSSVEAEQCDSSVKPSREKEIVVPEKVVVKKEVKRRKAKKRELSQSDFVRVLGKEPRESNGDDRLPPDVKQLRDFRLAMRLESHDSPSTASRKNGSDTESEEDPLRSRQNFWFPATSFVPLRSDNFDPRSKRNPAVPSNKSSTEEEESPVDVRRRLLSNVKRNLKAQNRQLKEAIRSQAFHAGNWRTRFANTLLSSAKRYSNKTKFLDGVFPKKATKVKAL